MSDSRRITVFEHQILRVEPGKGFTPDHLNILLRYSETDRRGLFEPVYNGVRFTSFVGAIRVGELLIEVLPKIDQVQGDEERWQRFLIQMLREAGMLRVHDMGIAPLHLLRQSVLELYFILFVQECEKLVHRGLMRRYRQTEGNLFVLKGALQFNRHVTQNLVHGERFYTRHTVYDHNNRFNRILLLALGVIRRVNLSPALAGRIQGLMAFFPEVDTIAATEQLFEALPYNRNTEHYRLAMEIARMILLSYHPDIRSGKNHVLALMFDMNRLWERWIYRQLLRHLPGWEVSYHSSCTFWTSGKSEGTTRLQPDFLLISPEGQRLIIDTKWKVPQNQLPSEQDLRQIFAYNLMFNTHTGILLYPGPRTQLQKGTYHYPPSHKDPQAQPFSCWQMYVNPVEEDGKLSLAIQLSSIGM